MGLSVKKSLLGFEDIFFDTNGTSATVQVLCSDGVSYRTVHKINVSHLPLPADIRAALGNSATMDAALTYIVETLAAAAGDASTTAKGLIELATADEVLAGLSSLLAVTPLTLAGLTATTARRGLIQIASEAETLDGSDGNKAVVPATLKAAIDAFNSKLTATGRLAQHGLEISNNVSDANNDIDIAPGGCFDSLYGYYMPLAATMTKRIDAAWTSGAGNGGLAAGLSLAGSTWYHLFLIYNITSGAVDAGFDTAIDASNLLGGATGFTKYQYIRSVLTDSSSHIIPFEMYGNRCYWKTPIIDFDVTNQSSTAVAYTVSAPPGIKCLVGMSIKIYSTINCGAYVTSPGLVDVVPAGDMANAAAAPLYTLHDYMGSGGGSNIIMPVEILTNASSQIRARANAAIAKFAGATNWWSFNRGW